MRGEQKRRARLILGESSFVERLLPPDETLLESNPEKCSCVSESAPEGDLKYSCSRVIDGLNRYRELADRARGLSPARRIEFARRSALPRPSSADRQSYLIALATAAGSIRLQQQQQRRSRACVLRA